MIFLEYAREFPEIVTSIDATFGEISAFFGSDSRPPNAVIAR